MTDIPPENAKDTIMITSDEAIMMMQIISRLAAVGKIDADELFPVGYLYNKLKSAASTGE